MTASEGQILSTVGVRMPPEFNAKAHDSVNSRVSSATQPNSRQRRSFAAAWNATAYRFLAASEADASFTHSVGGTVSPPPQERYIQDNALFTFFVAACSTLESFYFSAYCIGAIIDPEAFPMGSPKDLKLYPDRVAKAFTSRFSQDELSNALSTPLDTIEYKTSLTSVTSSLIGVRLHEHSTKAVPHPARPSFPPIRRLSPTVGHLDWRCRQLQLPAHGNGCTMVFSNSRVYLMRSARPSFDAP